MPARLSNKRCLVTGAAQGIGKAITDAFLREGAYVIATDLQLEKLKAEFTHPHARIMQMDVTDAAAVNAIAAASPEINVLVNCAGFVAVGSLLDCNAAQLERSFQINVMTMFNTIQSFLPAMRERKTDPSLTLLRLSRR